MLQVNRVTSSVAYPIATGVGFYLLPASGPSEYSEELKGEIHTSKALDRFGNKSCRHNEVYGAIQASEPADDQYAKYRFLPYDGVIPSSRPDVVSDTVFRTVIMGNHFLVFQYAFKPYYGKTIADVYAIRIYFTGAADGTTCQPQSSVAWDARGSKFIYASSWEEIISLAPASVFRDISVGSPPTRYVSTSAGNRTVSGEKTKVVQRDLNAILAAIHNELAIERPQPKVAGLSRLSLQAAESARPLSINGIAYLNDLRNLTSEIKGIYDLLKGKADLKSLNELYLEYLYGLRLTVSDTQEILERFSAQSRAIPDGTSITSASYRDSSENVESEEHLKIYYNARSEALDSLISAIDSYDLLPTAENVWDLIPYSFVVDWVFNIGDILNDVDNLQRLERLHIISAVYSRKTTVTVPVTIGKTASTIRYVSYSRSIVDSFPPPSFDLTSNLSGLLTHWCEGTSLLIANL